MIFQDDLKTDEFVDLIVRLSAQGNLCPETTTDQIAKLLWPDNADLKNDFFYWVMGELYKKRESLPWRIDKRYRA